MQECTTNTKNRHGKGGGVLLLPSLIFSACNFQIEVSDHRGSGLHSSLTQLLCSKRYPGGFRFVSCWNADSSGHAV